MTAVSLARVKALSAFLAIVLTFSVATIDSANAAPKAKGKKSSASARSKSQSRSGKTAARSGKSRSSKATARNSKGTKGKGKYYASRGRGRRGGRSKWRSQVATSSHTVGVHNYLSQAWTQPLSPAEKSSAAVEGGTAGNSTPASSRSDRKTGIEPLSHTAVPDATRPRVS